MTCQEYLLPAAPTEGWLRLSLRGGPSLSLSVFVECRLDWRSLTYTTFAKEGLTDRELSEFAVGGKTGSAESDKWLVDWLTNSPIADGMVTIVEDWRASPTSSFLSAKDMPAFFCGQEVYYLMREHDPGRFPYWRRVFANAVPTFHAFVVSNGIDFRLGENIPSGTIKKLAENVVAVICGAYDGESYVIGVPHTA